MGYNTSSLKLVTNMPLNNLKIVNFRNILNTELTLDNEINVILGSNGQGKTSLLESIYFLINGKSDKTNDLNEIKNINNLFISKQKFLPILINATAIIGIATLAKPLRNFTASFIPFVLV